MSDIEKTRDDAAECWAGAAIGAKAGTKGFKMLVDSSKSCKVNVLTTVHGKPIPVVRFDAAHAGFNVPHINVNPKVNTKLTADPHLPIPFGEAGLQASQTTAKYLKVVNKVLIPVAIAVDIYQGGKAIVHDYSLGSTRNTVETTASIGGGWLGGYGGAASGAAIGSAIFPGIGTIVGGIAGGIAGGIGGSVGAGKVVELIGDELEYNVEFGEKPCQKCGKKYKYKKYVRKDNGHCDECSACLEHIGDTS